MREQFDSLQEQHGDKVRQLQRLQSEVTSIALNDDGIQGAFHFELVCVSLLIGRKLCQILLGLGTHLNLNIWYFMST